MNEQKEYSVKQAFKFNFGRLALGRGKANFPLYHTPAILSREILYKIAGYFFPIIVQHYHLQSAHRCAIILVSRGGTRVESTFATPATLLPSGNTQASNGCTQLGQIFSKKFEKNLLTNHRPCGIIRVSRGESALCVLLEQDLSKKFIKPLDKPHMMWYNKGVPKGTK